MTNNNNLICDLETGMCGVSEDDEMQVIDFNQKSKSIDLYYVTDPICSHCWALEPVLRRFVEQYGHYVNFHTTMGGLLEKWTGFADVSNGISSPSDVAGHWREVGEHSRMPIDGTLWFENPIQSSYPPSRVFKVIQQQNEDLANIFLRRTREAVFVFNQNIAEKSVLFEIVNHLGLDGEKVLKKAELPIGQQLLTEDFALASQLGVRGFPTIIMLNEENKGVKIVGSRTLDSYIAGLKQVLSLDELQPKQQPALLSLLEKEKLLFSKEVEVMYDIEQKDINKFVDKELSSTAYDAKEILGETYFVNK
ncbi:DsbA family protein [Lysinibacillus agricola]|uniref:DsbA family protein n=1 Tax=Lysinibacillus agricola TaxID=2590012 RepID=A0ABX7AYL3_9BACI|nr:MULTISPECIES: DsbA family protein [Lysinibacillus]KOS63362.1 dithiol-disulfide isomerase [Lysinibacillus sp. FJAT-14222]QQP15105.1 DsbA family protein [Lysinibacillus agricola]